MSEAPDKRFRRIIKSWREQQQDRQHRVTTLARASSGRASRDSPLTTAEPARVPDPPPQTADGPAVEPLQPALDTIPHSGVWDRPRRTGSLSEESGLLASSADGTGQATARVALEMPPSEPPTDGGELETPADAHRFLERLRAKTTQAIQDFSDGVISQRQFKLAYARYQRQRLAVEQALKEMPDSGAWRAVVVDEATSFLRENQAAQLLGYAIYVAASGTRVTQVGSLGVDDAFLKPILSKSRSGEQELFGSGMQHTQIEGGRWLCWMSGRSSTLVFTFSVEPATIQLQMIEDLHRDFELMNQRSLSNGDISQITLTSTHLRAFARVFIEMS